MRKAALLTGLIALTATAAQAIAIRRDQPPPAYSSADLKLEYIESGARVAARDVRVSTWQSAGWRRRWQSIEHGSCAGSASDPLAVGNELEVGVAKVDRAQPMLAVAVSIGRHPRRIAGLAAGCDLPVRPGYTRTITRMVRFEKGGTVEVAMPSDRLVRVTVL